MRELIRCWLKDRLSILFYIFRIFPINYKKIIFSNFDGKGFGDSPKYIANYIHNQDKNIKIIWVVKQKYNDFPSYIKQIKYLSVEWFYNMATALVWVNNSRFPSFVRKRKKQLYIQTWHGGLALKRIEYDSPNLPLRYRRNMKNDTKMTNYMLSNSDFCTRMYKRAFRYDGAIIEYGTPRNDDLINNIQLLKERALKNLKINDNSIFVLYAPTFRDAYNENPYDIDFSKLITFLKDKYNKDVYIMIKMHPNAIKYSSYFNYSKYVLNMSEYSDVQELISLADCVITDYSSTMFESMMANKFVVIYAKDYDSYLKNRGFYFDFDKLPFDIAKNNEELIKIFKNNILKSKYSKYDNFKKNIGLKETGQSTKKISSIILDYIRLKGEKNEQK